MSKEIDKKTGYHLSPFERIKRTNGVGNEYWSSRDFASTLGYSDYRNFEAVVEKEKLSCVNASHRVEDHFVDVNEMIAARGNGTPQHPTGRYLGRCSCDVEKSINED